MAYDREDVLLALIVGNLGTKGTPSNAHISSVADQELLYLGGQHALTFLTIYVRCLRHLLAECATV